jgi:hypothetical protein
VDWYWGMTEKVRVSAKCLAGTGELSIDLALPCATLRKSCAKVLKLANLFKGSVFLFEKLERLLVEV